MQYEQNQHNHEQSANGNNAGGGQATPYSYEL